MQKVTCKICNKEFNAITASHLKQHDITRLDYVEMFPEEKLATGYFKPLPKIIAEESTLYEIDRRNHKRR